MSLACFGQAVRLVHRPFWGHQREQHVYVLAPSDVQRRWYLESLFGATWAA